MAAKTFTDFKDDFRLEYGRLPTLEETWKAAKRADALKSSHNSAITKCEQCEHYNNESLADICSGCCHMYISRFTLRK